MENMSAAIILIRILGFIVGIIWLVVRLVKRTAMKLPTILIVISFILVISRAILFLDLISLAEVEYTPSQVTLLAPINPIVQPLFHVFQV